MIGVFAAASDMATYSTSSADGEIVSRGFDC